MGEVDAVLGFSYRSGIDDARTGLARAGAGGLLCGGRAGGQRNCQRNDQGGRFHDIYPSVLRLDTFVLRGEERNATTTDTKQIRSDESRVGKSEVSKGRSRCWQND